MSRETVLQSGASRANKMPKKLALSPVTIRAPSQGCAVDPISQMRKWRLRGSATEPASRAALMPTPRRVLSPHLRENRQLLGLVPSQPLLCLSDPLPSRPHTARPKVTPKPVWRLALWGSERSSETWALGLLPVRDVLLLQRRDVTSRGGQGNASKSGLVSEPTWKGARAAASLACEMEDVS